MGGVKNVSGPDGSGILFCCLDLESKTFVAPDDRPTFHPLHKNAFMATKKIQRTAGKAALFIFIIFSTIGCGKSKLTVEESQKTVVLPSGKVQMFGRNDFELNIPELEVNIYEVTNASFTDFVKKTGYITTAEKTGEGMVFDLQKKEWILIKGARWFNPRGPGSTINGKETDPVVQVSYEDGCAYCEWLEMRLPYESEWEYMFQLDQTMQPTKKFNKWDGIFPIENKKEDGFENTAPVGSFQKGSKGIYDLQGNVWEWCIDLYHQKWPQIDTMYIDSKYFGPSIIYNDRWAHDTLRVIKGGSFLCAENYCRGYAEQKRQSADPHLSYEHIGFRCVRELTKK
jgi:sulfatase modifying factor 1